MAAQEQTSRYVGIDRTLGVLASLRKGLPWLIAGALSVVSATIVVAYANMESDARRIEQEYVANLIARSIADYIELRVRALDHIQARLQAIPTAELDQATLERETAHAHATLPGFLGINVMDAERYIKLVTPKEANQSALGRRVGQTPDIVDIVERARDRRTPTSTSPVDLFQGGKGIATYFPLFRGSEFTGYVNAVIRLPEFWHVEFAKIVPGVAIAIADGDKTVLTVGDPSPQGAYSTISVRFLDRVWVVRSVLPQTAAERIKSVAIGVVAGLVALLSAAAAWLYQSAVARGRELVAARNQLAQFVDLGSDWTWEIDAQGRYRNMTRGSSGFKWYSDVQPGDPVAAVAGFDPKDPNWRPVIEHYQARRAFRDLPVRVPNPDDPARPRTLHISGQPIVDDAGNYQGYRGISREVTAVYETQDRLKLFQAAVDQAPAPIFITDAKGDISYVNPAFTAITGYGADEVIGKRPRALRGEPVESAVYDGLRKTVARGEVWRGDLPNRTKDGAYYWEQVEVAPVRDQSGAIAHTIGVIENITNRKALEASLRLAKESAEASDRAKSQFIANVNHELRTPLNAIIGFSEIIAGNLFPREPARYVDYAADIVHSARHLQGIVDDILDLSSTENNRHAGNRSEFQLMRLLEAALRMSTAAMGAARERIVPRIACSAELVLNADERGLKQVLINLLTNSLKYGDGKTQIRLDIAAETGGGLSFRVVDRGVGIPPEDLVRLFQPFERGRMVTKNAIGGIGLGLVVSRKIVEAHGGKLWLDSTLGVGTTAAFTLPAECIVDRPAA